MKITATLSAINVLGDSNGDIKTKINEKEYNLSYNIRPYYYKRNKDNRHNHYRIIAINFPDSKTLNDFGIEVDFTKVKLGVGRAIVKSIKDRELAKVRVRGEDYDKASIHKLYKDVKGFLAALIYKGIVIDPTFTYSTKKDFVYSYYNADQIPLYITYKWADSEKKDHEAKFEIGIKQTYHRGGLKDNSLTYYFRGGHNTIKGGWKRLDKIALKIEDMVKDNIDSIERCLEGDKKRQDNFAETKAELGAGVAKINGNAVYVKREPILEGEEYKKSNYAYEWKVEFNRHKDDQGSKYQYVKLSGTYTPEQMKRIIEIAMEAKPEEVYK